MKRHAFGLTAIGCLLVAVAVLAGLQWQARHKVAIRGWDADVTSDVPLSTHLGPCINASLDQYAIADLPMHLGYITDAGFHMVRQHISWADVAVTQDRYDWTAYDAVIDAATAEGLTLWAVLDTPPDWAGDPPDADAYTAFVQAVAERYGDRLDYYQIWHNPNIVDWGGDADAYDYAAMLIKAGQAIRETDPGAVIILGSLAPNGERGDKNFNEALYLDMLADAGAWEYFDVISVQAYGYDDAPYDRHIDENDTFNFSRAVLVQEALADLPGEKRLWISHFGWNHVPAGVDAPESLWGEVTAEEQAQFTSLAMDRARREWPWMDVMCLNSYQPRPVESAFTGAEDAETHWGFALVTPDGEPTDTYAQVQSSNTQDQGIAPAGNYHAVNPYTSYEGDWEFGAQGADIGQSGDRVTFTFEGTDVALTVRRGPYRAFLFVLVDGKPAPALPQDDDGRAYVVLYDPLSAVATVPLAEGLDYGTHTVEVIAERGWDQWALADWRVRTAPELGEYYLGMAILAVLGLVGVALTGINGNHVAWGKVGESFNKLLDRLKTWGLALVAIGFGALAFLGTWQTLMDETLFRRFDDRGFMAALLLCLALFYFSPWFVLALVTGLILAAMLFARPALGLALAVACAPLYMHPMSLFGKSFALTELMLIPAVAGTLLRYLRERPTRPVACQLSKSMRRALITVAALLGWGLVTALAAEHVREGLREWRLILLEPALFFTALLLCRMSGKERWRVLDAFVVSAVVVSLVGLVQYFFLDDVITAEGGMRRLHSVYGSPNNVGLYLGRALPFIVAMVLWSGKRVGNARDTVRVFFASRRRWLYALALLPVAAALALSLSRGAIVLGIPAALLFLGFTGGKTWRRITMVALVLAALAMIPLLSTPRFAGMFDLSGTAGFRINLWKSSLKLLKDHPIFGVGPDNFLYAYRTRYVLPTAWEEFNLSHPHNVLFGFTVRMGLPGLALFLVMQILFWREAWRQRKSDSRVLRAVAVGLMASMVDFWAHGLVDAAYFVIDLAYVYFLTWAVILWLPRWEDTRDDATGSKA